MTERITSQMLDLDTVTTINDDLTQLDQTQEQLSSGYRITEPSDDPFGESMAISLNGQISALSSYTTNIDEGISQVETASSSLQSIQSVLESAQELTTEGANGTMSSSELDDAAQEVLEYIGQIKETADTQYDGSYVFSGSATGTAPYDQSTAAGTDTFQGNTNTIDYAIGPTTTVPINANLYSVLGDGNGTDGGLLSTMRAIYDDMTGTSGGSQSDLSSQLTALRSNQEALEEVQAQVGGVQDRLQMASTRITSLSTTDTTELGDVADTDTASATVKFSTESASYQAALQAAADIVQTSLLNYLQT